MALTKVIGDGVQGISNSSDSTAITIGSDEVVDFASNADFIDGRGIRLGAGNDFQLYHDGTDNHINVTGSQTLNIQTSGNNAIVVDANGHVNKPLQSSFQAVPDADITNITGDATTAALTDVAYTETFDVNGDFNAANEGANLRGTFTAPVTGKYYIGYTLCYSGITSASTSGVHALSTSNRTYNNNFNPYNFGNVGTNGNITFSAICDMDANDTAHVTLYVNGNGSKVVDILASQHKFFGMLIG